MNTYELVVGDYELRYAGLRVANVEAENGEVAMSKALAPYLQLHPDLSASEVQVQIVKVNGKVGCRSLRTFTARNGGGYEWELYDYESDRLDRFRTDHQCQGLWSWIEDGLDVRWNQTHGHMQFSISGASVADAASHLMWRWKLIDERAV